jgi:membrane-anchored glycerophosphoryl diester phosphodiesterase (GDPDase)
MPISMSAVWDESAALIRRESHLLVPLALATVGIGSVISGLTQPQTPAAGLGATAAIGFIVGNLFTLVGTLAIIALALTPGISVGESLRLALARMPKMILIGILFVVAIIALMIPLAVILGLSGVPISASMAPQDLPGVVVLAALMIGALLLYISARLLTLSATMVDRNPPIIEAIKSSFSSTGGIATKIIAVLLLFLLVTIVVSGAVAAISGILFGMIGKAVGAPLLGKGLTVLVTGMVSALLSIVSSVFAAMLYRKLSAQ